SSAPPSTRSSRSSTGSSKAPDDAYSAFAKEYADGKHLPELSFLLRERGLPVPEDASALELSDGTTPLEALLLWPESQVVLVAELTDTDRAAWSRAGYQALDYDA